MMIYKLQKKKSNHCMFKYFQFCFSLIPFWPENNDYCAGISHEVNILASGQHKYTKIFGFQMFK